jgi:nucleotide-binding universal stress UspA family protein
MFERILLPLDGSDIAEMSLRYGQELSTRLGSDLILYHVHSHEHLQQEHMYQVYLDSLAQSLQSNIGKNQTKVTTKVEEGDPTDNICNLVEKNRIDLIIMTAVSASGIKVGKMLGSVTDHICRTVPIPVMLIRPKHDRQIDKNEQLLRRMIIPLDGSELSKLALPVGEELATKLKLITTIFQMSTMIRLYDDGSGFSAYNYYVKFNEDEKDRVGADMQVIEKGLKEKGIDVTSVVTSGIDAAYEIIELCKKINADLVVMSTHGRTGLGRWVFGNVAEKVLRHGETPLLMVHAR